MARTNLDVVREVNRLFGQAARGEPTRELFDLFAPDVEIDMTRRVFNPDIYEGHAGLRRLGREVGEAWGEFRVDFDGDATNIGSQHSQTVVEWDSAPPDCPAGQLEVLAGYRSQSGNTPVNSVDITTADEAFSFVIP